MCAFKRKDSGGAYFIILACLNVLRFICQCIVCSNNGVYFIGLVATFTETTCPLNVCTANGECEYNNCYDCPACRRRWRWIDGSAYPGPGYEGEWRAREPKQMIGQNLKCVSMVKNAYGVYWQSASCSERLNFICKICTCILFEFVLSILLNSTRWFCKHSNYKFYSRFRAFMLK